MDLLPTLKLSAEALKDASLLINEQKYIDLIVQKEILQALEVLREKIKPFYENSEKLHKLASLIMCQNAEELYEKIGVSSLSEAKKQLLANIRAKCRPETMIEPNRLENLLSQAVSFQMFTCKYHNNAQLDLQNISLIEQHECSCEETPGICSKTVKDKDEIWIVRFSPDGDKIANVCKKNTISMWELNMEAAQILLNVIFFIFLLIFHKFLEIHAGESPQCGDQLPKLES